jgi:RNA polymerase subunit RPABC4/transcription elongation factor Spt4
MHVRVCRECGEEYRPDIAVCADCGGELADHYEDERGQVIGTDGVPVAPARPTPGIPAHALFSGTAGALRLLADALVARGVPFQLVPEEKLGITRFEPSRLVLVVPETESARALDALAEYRGRGTELGFTELATSWGGDHEGDAPCPACGGHVPHDATFCPDCGLELGGHEE